MNLLKCKFLLTLLMSCTLLPATGYQVRKLVSQVPLLARHFDPTLKNPWGLTFSPLGNLVVANNLATIFNPLADKEVTSYTARGVKLPFEFDVTGGGIFHGPTAIEQNPFRRSFIFSDGGTDYRAEYIVATTNGKIGAFNRDFNPNATKVLIDNSDSNYTGLTLGKSGLFRRLYVANFRKSSIELYDSNFTLVIPPVGAFVDNNPPLPPLANTQWAPFNVAALEGNIYVTYALRSTALLTSGQLVTGMGYGYINIFTPDGVFVNRLVNFNPNQINDLNAPWGLAMATKYFGEFSGALLVGNHGNGTINAYDSITGQFLGQLQDADGAIIALNGLWSMKFHPFDARTLYFSSGPETQILALPPVITGLVGSIRAENSGRFKFNCCCFPGMKM